MDLRVGAVILEFRDVERAGDHAVAATHAFVAVPGHRSHPGLVHGLRKAGGGTGRFIAVHALAFKEHCSFRSAVFIHHRVPCFVRFPEPGDLLGRRGLRQAVRYGAVVFAAPATLAAGCIVQNPSKFNVIRTFSRGFRISSDCQSGSGGTQYLQEASSVYTHDSVF
jgi:hypothetical protein